MHIADDIESETKGLPGNPGDPGRSGADGNLIDPVVMRAPVMWLASQQSDGWNGKRFIGQQWDTALAADEAAAGCSAPPGSATGLKQNALVPRHGPAPDLIRGPGRQSDVVEELRAG